MTQEIIDIGTAPNDGLGDPLRTAFTKTNDNFTELYAQINLKPSNRICVIGDSHLMMGYATSAVATTAGRFVVSGGIATIIITGTSYLGIGNYVYLINQGDTTYADSLNGAYVKVLTAPDNNTITVSATFNGNTMADGDYSNIGGIGWTVVNPLRKTDSSVLNWLRQMNSNPWIVTQLSCLTGQTAVNQRTLLPKILAGPAFDIAVISLGTNDVQTSPVATSMRLMYRALDDILYIASELIAAGKFVYITTANGDLAANSNTLPKAQSLAVMRKLLIQWAARQSQAQILDTFANSIDGTLATGAVLALYCPANDVHLSTYGNYYVTKQISSVITKLPYVVDQQPIALFEDNATYAQLATAWVASTAYVAGSTPDIRRNGVNVYRCIVAGTSASSGGPTGTGLAIVDGTVTWQYVSVSSPNIVTHGMMDSSGGTNGTSGDYVGTVPASWTLTRSGGSGTTTSNATRTAIGTTQSASWGKAWQISSVFTVADQTVTCSQNVYPGIVKGGWYQFGITITALNNWLTNVKSLRCYIPCGAGAAFFQVNAIFGGNNTTTFPLVANDVFEIESEPFYIDPTNTFADATFTMILVSAAAATVNFELASAWMRAIPDPYL